MAKDANYPENKAHLAFGQKALSEIVADVENDAERYAKVQDTVGKWNDAPPLSVRSQ